MRELNFHQREGSCRLVIKLLSLWIPHFEKELQVSVHASRVFHFYVDFDENSKQKYALNRKITLKGSFEEFEKWMSQPVTIILR